MKIRRSMVVLFVMATFIIPVSIYRSMFSADASVEFLGTIDIIYNVLMGIFLLLTFSFSLFTDDFPHSYSNHQSRFLGLITMLLAASIGYSAVLNVINEEYAVFTGTSGIIFSVMGVLSVLAFMFYSVTYFKGENVISSVALIPAFPAVWYGYRMLLCFLKSASMADISGQLPIIAMCCSYTIFLITVGKLFSCVNSNSVKWGFASGCIGVITTVLYTTSWLLNECHGISDILSHPLIFTDLFMVLFTIGSLFHISSAAEYFDDEQWDDYFYETYDLPKPNLVLHTPVDELEEDSLLDDDIDEAPYIPVDATIGNGNPELSSPPQGMNQAPPIPSYIANPAAYPPQPPVAAPYPPSYPPAAYYPSYPPAYPTYPYPPAPVYDYYPQPPIPPTEYYNPYDAAAAQYQYERRRAELQSRELEKLTGEVDSSLARLQNNVAQTQEASNEYVAVSPDEKIGGRFNPAPSGRNIHLAQGYIQSGERITDHLDRIERESQQYNQPEYDDTDEYDDYTYEYYYPTDGRSRYNLNQFDPNNPNNRR